MTATPVSNVPSATLRGSPRKGLAAWSWLDAVLLLAVLAVLGYFAWKAATVFKYKWDWSTIWPFIYRFATATGRWVPNLLVEGFLTTIRLAVWGILFAGILGTLTGLVRKSNRLFFRLLGGSYVMLIRSILPVVSVFVFVFFIASQIMPKIALGDSVGRKPCAMCCLRWRGSSYS